MFNSVVLDVVIGLVFAYLLYSLLATTILELLATKLAFRAKVLEKAILRMLEDGKTTSNIAVRFDRISGFWHLFSKQNLLLDKPVAAWFYAHPLIKYMGEDNFYSKPAYLSSQNFSKVLLDLLKGFEPSNSTEQHRLNDSIKRGVIYPLAIDIKRDSKNPAIKALRFQLAASALNVSFDEISNNKKRLKAAFRGTSAAPQTVKEEIDPGKAVKMNLDTTLFLQSLWRDSGYDVERFKQKLEAWFDDTMERTTGWYKRYTRYILFIVGLFLAVGFNLDSISMAKKLSKDPKLREQMVQSATIYVEKNKELGEQLKNTKPTDTLYKQMSENYSSLSKRTDVLLDSIKQMMNSDIDNVNHAMALGWNVRKEPVNRTWLNKVGHTEFSGLLCFRCNPIGWISIIGWIISALAISLGAPFWFDLLSKLTKIRGTGTKVDPSDQQPNSSKSITPQPMPAPVHVTIHNKAEEEAVG